MKLIEIIKASLKPYIGKQITVSIFDRVWDKQLKDWVDKEVRYTGIFKGLMSTQRYEYSIDEEFDEFKIKLVNKEGKGRFIKVNMQTKFEFPKD